MFLTDTAKANVEWVNCMTQTYCFSTLNENVYSAEGSPIFQGNLFVVWLTENASGFYLRRLLQQMPTVFRLCIQGIECQGRLQREKAASASWLSKGQCHWQNPQEGSCL